MNNLKQLILAWSMYADDNNGTLPANHQYGIDAFFTVSMALPTRIVDWPASYHNNAGGLAFADAHAQIRKWVDPRTRPVLKKGQVLGSDNPCPGNPDVTWLQDRNTSKK